MSPRPVRVLGDAEVAEQRERALGYVRDARSYAEAEGR